MDLFYGDGPTAFDEYVANNKARAELFWSNETLRARAMAFLSNQKKYANFRFTFSYNEFINQKDHRLAYFSKSFVWLLPQSNPQGFHRYVGVPPEVLSPARQLQDLFNNFQQAFINKRKRDNRRAISETKEARRKQYLFGIY